MGLDADKSGPMKRGFPTDPSLIVVGGGTGPGSLTGTGSGSLAGSVKGRVVELRPLLRESVSGSGDSGLGPSFLGSSYDASMLAADQSDLTPKSNRSDASDLNTPQPTRRRFLYRGSEGSPLAALKAEQDTENSSPLQLSSSNVSEYRFDGASISSTCPRTGLTKLGSPETAPLQNPCQPSLAAQQRPAMSRRLDMSRPVTPSRCLPFSPSKDLSGSSDFLGFPNLSTSTPVRTEFVGGSDLPPQVLPTALASPTRKRSIPLTPTPIKRAMAFAMANSKTTPPRALQLPPDLGDVEDMIRKESGGGLPTGTTPAGIDYSTPSKLMRWEGLPGLCTGALLSEGLGVGVGVGALAEDPILQGVHLFQPPPITPERMSDAWRRIALGGTSPQRELTAKAHLLLAQPSHQSQSQSQQGPPPPANLRQALNPELTPERLTYAQL